MVIKECNLLCFFIVLTEEYLKSADEYSASDYRVT